MQRAVFAVAPDTGGVELSGALRASGQSLEQRSLGRDPTAPDADRLTMLMRLAMETVEGWSPSGGATSPASSVAD
jgi:hypothetical protein